MSSGQWEKEKERETFLKLIQPISKRPDARVKT